MRKKKHEEHENHERWLVSYADFITLLFAFFVVLYATSTQNEEKEKKFEQSIRAEFKMVGMGGNYQGSAPISYGQVIDPLDPLQKPRLATADLEDQIELLLEKSMSEQERKATIADLRHDAVGVRITLAAANFFPSGSAKLKLGALKTLDKVAAILKKANRTVIIEGHTDDQPVNGGQYESNWELASLRATSVVRYLVKYQKMDSQKLGAISYADQRPVAPNTTEENRNKNRRIEILIVNTDDSQFNQ